MAGSSNVSDVDVAVVGGGAAGIAAARDLLTAGFSVLLLEAGPTLGGRAHTAVHGGYPLDLGCGWLHSADHNPWAALAEQYGILIDRTRPPWERQTYNHDMSREEQAAFRKAFAAYDRRIEKARLPPDRPAGAFLEPGSRWNTLLDAVSTWFNGVELAEMSALDYRNFDDTEENWRIPSGYGALVTHHAHGIPTALNTPVREIDHRGSRLRLVTSRGELTAGAAVVAVPTHVISGEVLRFTPALPGKIEDAGHLPLGTVNKVYLTCATPEMFPADGHLFGTPSRVATGSYHLRPFGRPLIEAFLGGKLAKDLASQNDPHATAQFAIDELVASIGSDLRKHLAPLAASAWESNIFIGGAYSHAVVGAVPARARLGQAVDERLFFAGEACSTHAYSTAHGALLTGRKAAADAAAALRKGLLHGTVVPVPEQTATPRRSAFLKQEDRPMAKYSESAGKDVESAMKKRNAGELKSGKNGKGGKVTSRKQAIAIGLSEARAKGKKVPKKKTAKKKATKKSAKKKSSGKARVR